ncbi:hypothetical protein TGCAST_389850 [Toxoplasma gondii CAST]|uniref:Uncharacterized protein n=1 Tax=Toxoplasma gondii CAST TaxID=943122 RepID=A0A425HLV8_TOXGO|nr:hypothetical protein TGCAST_389850 [Toxoplasma gondii CAST]
MFSQTHLETKWTFARRERRASSSMTEELTWCRGFTMTSVRGVSSRRSKSCRRARQEVSMFLQSGKWTQHKRLQSRLGKAQIEQRSHTRRLEQETKKGNRISRGYGLSSSQFRS